MSFSLPPLPFAKNALEPHISSETMEFHYEKHHGGYVNKLNELVQGTPFETFELEEIIRKAGGKIFNNAAQVWNHTFFWNCLSPDGTGGPNGILQGLIEIQFKSVSAFQELFSKKAVDLFGSGWIWLSLNDRGQLSIDALINAGNPMRNGRTPLLALDVWEHAYYLDYRNERAKFIEVFWPLINWNFVAQNLEKAQPPYTELRAS